MPELIAGELVAAAVVDARVWESQGNVSPDGIYLTGQPGPALPFVMFRAWKVPVGIVQEEVRLFGPSGRMMFRWGPEYRRMAGMFDLTTEVDHVERAVFEETGMYVASFVIDDQVLGEIEVPVYVQAEPPALDKSVEEGLKKSDVIWVGADVGGKRKTVPAWFAYKYLNALRGNEIPSTDDQVLAAADGDRTTVVAWDWQHPDQNGKSNSIFFGKPVPDGPARPVTLEITLRSPLSRSPKATRTAR